MFKKMLFTVLIAAAPLGMALAGDRTDFIKVRPDRDLYVQYVPARHGKPTVVLLNGLTYSTKEWEKMATALKEAYPGVGVLAYDMYGMGETLLRHAKHFTPISPAPQHDLPLASQAEDLAQLLKALQIPGEVHLLGLSYGGGVALEFLSRYPQTIKSVILLAPLVRPVQQQDQWIRSQMIQYRFFFPLVPITDDALYDYFLRQLVYTTYPLAEPILLTNPYKLEATYRMVQGAKNFNALDNSADYPENSVHLIVPENDEYVDRQTYNWFWLGLPEPVKASRLLIQNGRHKIPEERPLLAAEWVTKILKNRYEPGKSYRLGGNGGTCMKFLMPRR